MKVPGQPRLNAKWYSPKTAAAMLEVSPSTVKLWCQQGRIPAFKRGKLWTIPVKIIEERLLQAERHGGDVTNGRIR